VRSEINRHERRRQERTHRHERAQRAEEVVSLNEGADGADGDGAEAATAQPAEAAEALRRKGETAAAGTTTTAGTSAEQKHAKRAEKRAKKKRRRRSPLAIVTHVRNEAVLLPHWLDHYQGVGGSMGQKGLPTGGRECTESIFLPVSLIRILLLPLSTQVGPAAESIFIIDHDRSVVLHSLHSLRLVHSLRHRP
jgi:hypothetical protein